MKTGGFNIMAMYTSEECEDMKKGSFILGLLCGVGFFAVVLILSGIL